MAKVMAEQGVDMAFRMPRGIDAALANGAPDAVITLGGAPCPVIPGAQRQDWDVPDPDGKPIEVMRQVRDEIEARVKQLIAALVP
jgi:protein-tyrosine-phosphatase